MTDDDRPVCAARVCREDSVTRYATQRPVLHVRAFVGEVGYMAEPDSPSCDVHVEGTVAADFLTDEAWEVIRDGYRLTHKGQEPIRALTSLTWQPLGASAIFDRDVPGTEA